MDDNTDIVERLRSMYYQLSRRQASTPFGERSELDGIPTLLYEAATKIHDLRGNEIQRLRQENATLTAERDALWRLTDRLFAEHDALRAERDEARREVCGLLVACHTDPDDEKPDPNLKHVHAEIRGWDCFKENT